MIVLNTPINTPFGRIGKIDCNWRPPKRRVEFLPGATIGKIRIADNKNVIIPIKIIPNDNRIDVTINPLKGEEAVFWIKNSLFYHMSNCKICLRYIMTHEFSHTIPRFIFPRPWELRGFGKNIMQMTHYYFTDAVIDRWNVKNKNYSSEEPIKSMIHIYGENKVNLIITNREHLFEDCMFFMRFASHCEMFKNNLHTMTSSFPYELQSKYGRLLDMMSTDYKGSIYPIYRLIREIAELILCRSQKEIIIKELERRFYTLSDIKSSWMHGMRTNKNEKKIFHQICNDLFIHPSQINNCIFDWKNTFKRILNVSPEDLEFISESLSKSTLTSDFRYTYFIDDIL
jgi:hypothetical protein